MEGRAFKAKKGQPLFIFLTLFMYLSDLLWKRKEFDFYYIIIVDINFLKMPNLITNMIPDSFKV
jgi:hypothetical protein